MSIREKIPFVGGNPYKNIIQGMQDVKGDHDAVALLPYDDGTFFMKGATFDKDLIGGQGGYETEDGDKIVMDGDGQPVRELFGVPMLLAVDPTEHAAAVDPIKALVAQKNNIGEWLRVDKKGNIVEVGEALESVADIAGDVDEIDVADMNIGIEDSTVEDALAEKGLTVEQARDEQVRAVMKELAKQGELTKVYDIAPPTGVAVADGGEPVLEEATHIAVDQSKAADLLPTTTSTTELNVAIDKARMEEHDEDKVKSLITYGIIIGAVMAGVFALLFAGVFALM